MACPGRVLWPAKCLRGLNFESRFPARWTLAANASFGCAGSGCIRMWRDAVVPGGAMWEGFERGGQGSRKKNNEVMWMMIRYIRKENLLCSQTGGCITKSSGIVLWYISLICSNWNWKAWLLAMFVSSMFRQSLASMVCIADPRLLPRHRHPFVSSSIVVLSAPFSLAVDPENIESEHAYSGVECNLFKWHVIRIRHDIAAKAKRLA